MTTTRLAHRVAALVVATTLAVLGSGTVAGACPVCFAADERARMSFLGTAVFLSALPFALFAGLAFWFWRELDRAKDQTEHAKSAARPTR